MGAPCAKGSQSREQSVATERASELVEVRVNKAARRNTDVCRAAKSSNPVGDLRPRGVHVSHRQGGPNEGARENPARALHPKQRLGNIVSTGYKPSRTHMRYG